MLKGNAFFVKPEIHAKDEGIQLYASLRMH